MPVGSVLSGLGSIIGAGTSLASGLYGAKEAREIAEQELALQRQQMDEQSELNQFQMNEYLDKKDYDRALQERIFEREDTAMQRGLEDYIEAGFSPLSALGQSANAGSVVSTSSAPSLNAPAAPNLSGFYGAVDHLVNGGSAAGAHVATFLSQMASQQHEINMEDLRFANSMDQLTKSHDNQKELMNLEAQLREGSAEAQHYRELEKIAETQEFQKVMAEFQANTQKYLQTNQQEWQQKQSNLDRQHQIDMQKSAHDQTLEALDVQDKQRQQYENKTLAHAWSDLTKEGKDLFVKMLRKFDSDTADFVENNTFGGDLFMRLIAMYESALPVVSATKDAVNPFSNLSGKRK